VLALNGVTLGMAALTGAMPCGEKVEEVLDPLLPGSEQFKLQHSCAIETSGLLLADCAFLQQSGMFVIEPSPSCAPTPTAPPSMAAMRVKAVNHFRIDVVTILTDFLTCQASGSVFARTRIP
jgi:hypothetical protein